MKTSLVYSLARHHDKYMDCLAKELDGELITHKSEITIRDYLVGLTNSYFGFDTVDQLRENSISKKAITLCHSTYGSIENLRGCTPSRIHEYFLAPAYWRAADYIENTIEYDGHYMMLYHYDNPPVLKQKDIVLFFPVSGIKDIKEIESAIEFIDKEIYIRPHPVILNGMPHKWGEQNNGIGLEEYIGLERKFTNVKVITENIELVHLLDEASYLMGTVPTSVLLEAAGRARIYNRQLKIIATGEHENKLFKYGISYGAEPFIGDFGGVHESILDHLVIGKKRQVEEIIKAINKVVRIN